MIDLFFVIHCIHLASIFKGVLGLGHKSSEIPRCAVVLLNLHFSTCKALRIGPRTPNDLFGLSLPFLTIGPCIVDSSSSRSVAQIIAIQAGASGHHVTYLATSLMWRRRYDVVASAPAHNQLQLQSSTRAPNPSAGSAIHSATGGYRKRHPNEPQITISSQVLPLPYNDTWI